MRKKLGTPFLVQKRSIMINGVRSSVSLEQCFWDAFKKLADEKLLTGSKLADDVAKNAATGNLSSAIRVYLFEHYRKLAEAR